MPVWNLGGYKLGAAVAGIGVGIAGVYLIQKLVRKFKDDRQKDKKSVNEIQPTPVELPPIKVEAIFADCFLKAGDKLLKRQNYLEGIACFTDGAGICPAETDKALKAKIYGCRSLAYKELNDQENVLKDCTMSLQHYNEDVDVYLRRAAAYLHYGKLQEALGDYATIDYLLKGPDIQLQSKIQEIIHLLARDKTTISFQYHSHMSPPKYVVDEFMERFHNHPLKIIDDGSSSLVRDRDRALVHAHKEFLAGNILVAFNLNPGDIVSSSNPQKYMLLLATAKFLNGSADVALGLLMRVDIRPIGNRDPMLSATILIQTASLFHWAQQPEQAERCFDRAIDIAPDNTDVFFHRGEEYLKLGNTMKAIENYTQALRFQPESIPAMTAKALALFRQANENVAHFHFKHDGDALFKEMVEKYHDHYMIHFLYAKVLTSRKDYKEAEKHFEIAHRLAPHIGRILTYKAEMYMRVDEKAKAFETYQKAIKIDYACVIAYEQIGYMQIERNLAAKALKLFDKGLPYAMGSEEFYKMYVMYFTAKSRIDVADNLSLSSSLDAKKLPP